MAKEDGETFGDCFLNFNNIIFTEMFTKIEYNPLKLQSFTFSETFDLFFETIVAETSRNLRNQYVSDIYGKVYKTKLSLRYL